MLVGHNPCIVSGCVREDDCLEYFILTMDLLLISSA